MPAARPCVKIKRARGRDSRGDLWAQEWENIYPLVAPKDADPGYDLKVILKERHADPLQMVRYGEGFFTSLGFAPLPKTFWERSLFVKPRNRDVVCHASAWDIDSLDDLRRDGSSQNPRR